MTRQQVVTVLTDGLPHLYSRVDCADLHDRYGGPMLACLECMRDVHCSVIEECYAPYTLRASQVGVCGHCGRGIYRRER